MTEIPEVVIDLSGFKTEIGNMINDRFDKLEQANTPNEETASLTENLDTPKPPLFDYRQGIYERVMSRHNKDRMWGTGGDYDVDAIATVKYNEDTRKHEFSLTESYVAELTETIGTIDPDCCIPEVWAAGIERDHVYPGSVFLGAFFMKWQTELLNKPGDAIHWCRIAPLVAGTLGCDEPTSTAPVVACPTCSLVGRQCSVAICVDDIEDVGVQLIDELNKVLGSCIQVAVDNYIFDVALSCTNGGTVTSTGPMTGSLLLEAMGTMQAGTYQPVKVIMHSVQFKSLMQDTNFTYANRFGNRDVINGGMVKQAYGVEVNESPKGTLVIGGGTYRALLLAQDAIGGALKRGMQIETEFRPTQRKRWIIASIRLCAVCLHPDGIVWIQTVETP